MYSRSIPSREVCALLLGAIAVAVLAVGVAASGAAAEPAGAADGPRQLQTAADAGAGSDVPAARVDSSVAGADSPVSAQEQDPLVEPCAAEMPDDYADPDGGTADTIGWVDGYWYDEPIDVNAADGLSESELEVLTARTAARAEALRCLTFEDGVPPVDVVSRDELADETGEQFANVSEDVRRFDNGVLSTLLMVGADNDSIDVRQASQSQTVAGYYSIQADRIVVVERTGEGSAVDETVLTHEVAHALQDQTFGIDRPGNVTMDRDNGLLGLVEGDASWVEHRYLQRCENDRWAEPCVTLGGAGENDSDGGSATGGDVEIPNWGLYLEQYQPYSDGPTFVRSIYRDGGWDAVDALYDDPPESALYVMSPDTYGDVELVEPTVADASGDWERLAVEGAPDYETVGPAGIGGMVIAPTYEYGRTEGIVSPLEFLNYGPDNELSELDPLVYEQAPVDGWRGDRMAVFERGDETATVWRSAWADGDEAAEFATAYRQLLDVHDASPVDGADGVYSFAESSDHEGAAAVVVENEEVLIVTAPSVSALETASPAFAARGSGDGNGSGDDGDGGEANGGDGAGDGADAGVGDDTAADDGDGTGADAGDDGSDAGNESDGDDSLPGFGVGAAAVAALIAVGWLARRSP